MLTYSDPNIMQLKGTLKHGAPFTMLPREDMPGAYLTMPLSAPRHALSGSALNIQNQHIMIICSDTLNIAMN